MLSDGTAVMLAEIDPETRSRIDTANPMRVQRAWDVFTATGRGLAWWHAHAPASGIATSARIVVMPASPALERNIARRIDVMLAHGVLDEVRAFGELDVSADLPAARAIGAAEFGRYLRGDASLDDARAATEIATRRFAKRQRTWLRGRMADWAWADPSEGDLLALVPAP
jgi:tRNA dimethylallyltransferase